MLPILKNAAAIVTSDTAKLANISRAIYVGVAGDVKVDLAGVGNGIVFKAAPVGLLWIQAQKVYAAGTTATNLVNLY